MKSCGARNERISTFRIRLTNRAQELGITNGEIGDIQGCHSVLNPYYEAVSDVVRIADRMLSDAGG